MSPIPVPHLSESEVSHLAFPFQLVENYVQQVLQTRYLSADAQYQQHIVAVPGLYGFIAAEIICHSGGALLVTATERSAQILQQTLAQSLGIESLYFPAWETFPFERLSPGVETVGARHKVLHEITEMKASTSAKQPVVITTIRALMQPIIISPEHPRFHLQVGKECNFQELTAQLIEIGYDNVDIVARAGQIAIRGGIIDIFPSTSLRPIRLDFFGDEISDMSYFSTVDQRSDSDDLIQEFTLYPARELYMTPALQQKAQEILPQIAPGAKNIAEKFSQGIYQAGAEFLASPLLDYPEFPLLLDFLDMPIVMFEQLRIERQAENLFTTSEEFHAAAWNAISTESHDSHDIAPLPIHESNVLITLDRVFEQGRKLGRTFYAIDELDDGQSTVIFPAKAAPQPKGDPSHLEEFAHKSLRLLAEDDSILMVVVSSDVAAQRVQHLLGQYDLPVREVDTAQSGTHVIQLVQAFLAHGFELPTENILIITDSELTGVAQTEKAETRKKRRPATQLHKRIDPLALAQGDLVVHEHHGVGRFLELAQRTVSGAIREYVVLEYAASKRGAVTDKLFVPMESLDLLSRYVGGRSPSLNKLGGSDWQKTKRAARKAVRDIAAELVKLYAARQSSRGYAFGPDTPWQRELEDSFPFVETPDQLAAIEDTKADMEKPIPMDRVIIGDVGYGKTEVAVRTAFKAVQDGKQVAVLVPTTLLADQHFLTFTERMQGFPVKIRVLSRFTTPKDSKKTIEDMAAGQVDIVIGTHRLLQTGVVWKNLGLVIVDEEQRFGVEHKEHITALHNAVDVLTLSATPIPRTLEMSLSGIREMSPITTPPTDRHPVLTYVGGYDEKQIQAAISRELLRDGQVFYIHNRVATIDKVASLIRSLHPEARVAVAHGQMSEELLEKTVDSFWNREIDVLVCTTIVETGLDISNANTLIVENSENLGLSQLHQLRGRVGRSKQRAYAYFLYSPEKSLTENAYDRLATIAQHNDLGAGMSVAMKDLEIRGAGNILGAEQSGHIAGVGFDLYVRLVGEAVEAYRSVVDGKEFTQKDKTEIRLDIPIDAHIPVEYISSERLRLALYRDIAAADDTVALQAIVEEAEDRYGPLPPPVWKLLYLAQLRQIIGQFGISEISVNMNKLKLSPVVLADSGQIRLKRLFPAAIYRATTNMVTIPLGRSTGDGSTAMRDKELLQFIVRTIRSLLDPPTTGQEQSSTGFIIGNFVQDNPIASS